MNGLFDEPPGATPLDPDDAAGLIPTWVATRGDLNSAELENIARAMLWSTNSSQMKSRKALLTSQSIKTLHKRMFGDVWRWAGRYRLTDTNIGVAWAQVPIEVHNLLEDALAQTADVDNLPWPPDELAVRFHHRLVAIHPFPNGNGRHARLAADLLVVTLGRSPFSWGAEELGEADEARARYLRALRIADADYDYEPLLDFARS